MNFLTETLKALKVETVSEAIPLIEWMRVKYNQRCKPVRVTLSPNHTVAECGEVLEQLNFRYNDHFSGTQITGIIMLKDGSWLRRDWVLDRECWLHYRVPKFECEPFNWNNEKDSNKNI